MTWLVLSDGSARSACGRFDVLRGDPGDWVLVDAEAGTVRRFDTAAAAKVVAQQLTRKGASK
jgi:hypothetical protein